MTEQETKEVVPSSVKSVSTNVHVSANREWFFYNYGDIVRLISRINALLSDQPRYLLEDEISFLKEYTKDFSKYRVHNQFKLATTDYLHLLTKALSALDSRMKVEEAVILDSNKDIKIRGQIVSAFSQLSGLLKDIRNTFFTDLEMIKQNPRRYVHILNYLTKGVNYLLRAYVYEYVLLSKSEALPLDEIVDFNCEIDRLYVDFNKQDFASPVYRMGSQIYEIYA